MEEAEVILMVGLLRETSGVRTWLRKMGLLEQSRFLEAVDEIEESMKKEYTNQTAEITIPLNLI